MWIALLYESPTRLRSAALACDQQPYGPAFWTDIQGILPAQVRDCEVAYADITSLSLVEQLLELPCGGGFSSALAASEEVDRHLLANGRDRHRRHAA